MQGQACKLQQIYTASRQQNHTQGFHWHFHETYPEANAGKPIVGAQVQDLQGRPLANIFGATLTAAKTSFVVKDGVLLSRPSCKDMQSTLWMACFVPEVHAEKSKTEAWLNEVCTGIPDIFHRRKKRRELCRTGTHQILTQQFHEQFCFNDSHSWSFRPIRFFHNHHNLY